ncbi:hypothetical protein CONCODRAFT_12243 [Conidiobolus coronatus NRRL 28638]|uniref:RNI-like protein n=1 Tax=Conidiobolus coronatus (strain ATCC 28846 / CBS 209.66 / NRRL 28638) TaxID=796925 RepID=A0A137NT95_CONC2|nr:hypothetical protein CONCODRAFT_12243 [Conidiobolus coronatus NRRL 28638]|eukprot:KXN66017.1 hypothetical protein CONCODRAFT_12243 [Conidiobolus coronatus NRRL 28638]
MTRILRSETKKLQNSDNLSSKLTASKMSKIIKRTDKKFLEINNEGNQKSGIWNINSIMSNIFAYTDRKDLIEFNTACKKWNNLINPIIHESIKLDSRWNVKWQPAYKSINNAAKIDAHVVECISNNAKYASLVKKFKFNYKLNPLRAFEFFTTFRFISSLTIEDCDMSQDQFLGIINPLTQLQELDISCLKIKNYFRKDLIKDAIQLPSSLKKLKLHNISLKNDPELFIQTINSHTNLVEFSSWQSDDDFLEPFCMHYPSLIKIEFSSNHLHYYDSLFTVFEHNPQLVGLKLLFGYRNTEFLSQLSNYLTNLEEVNLTERYDLNADNTVVDLNLSQPTKIKKLYLQWDRLSNSSLNSILLNCPHLEELNLNPHTHYKQFNPISFNNISIFFNLKKLAISCDKLSEDAFDTLLLSCPHLNELSIILPCNWKEAVKSIYNKCGNLQRLNIIPSFGMSCHERDAFYQEFYQSEFFTGSPSCKFNLTHLIFEQFKVHGSKAEYFKNFDKLRSIKYPYQKYRSFSKFNKFGIEMDLWSDYELNSNDNDTYYDIELKR